MCGTSLVSYFFSPSLLFPSLSPSFLPPPPPSLRLPSFPPPPSPLSQHASLAGTLSGHSSWVLSVAYCPDNQQFCHWVRPTDPDSSHYHRVNCVCRSSDKTVKIWDVSNRECCHTFKEHSDQVTTTIDCSWFPIWCQIMLLLVFRGCVGYNPRDSTLELLLLYI